MSDVGEVCLRVGAAMAAFLFLPLLVGQTEHKVMAHMQGRLGPMEAGRFHGWAQLIADGLKFAQKEQTIPARADQVLFRLAPYLALVPYLVVFVLLPIGPTGGAAQPLELGLFVVLAFVGVGVVGVVMAGWSSGNKYSLMGGARAAAQLLAYELPLILSAVSVALAAGTLSIAGIVEAWEPWWLLWQAPAALVFFVAALAELRRPPFDAPIADSELVVGFLTEYTGLRFALFLLAEYAGIVVMSALTALLFLGGWEGPGSEGWGWLWLALKTFAVAFAVIWIRVASPRLREDQIQRFAWLVLVPVALAQIVLTVGVRVVLAHM